MVRWTVATALRLPPEVGDDDAHDEPTAYVVYVCGDGVCGAGGRGDLSDDSLRDVIDQIQSVREGGREGGREALDTPINHSLCCLPVCLPSGRM